MWSGSESHTDVSLLLSVFRRWRLLRLNTWPSSVMMLYDLWVPAEPTTVAGSHLPFGNWKQTAAPLQSYHSTVFALPDKYLSDCGLCCGKQALVEVVSQWTEGLISDACSSTAALAISVHQLGCSCTPMSSGRDLPVVCVLCQWGLWQSGQSSQLTHCSEGTVGCLWCAHSPMCERSL